MDKKSIKERLAALTAKASEDPKNIDGLVDAVSEDDAFIQKVVEKIMGKMDAKDGAGSYSVPATAPSKKEAALSKVVALLAKAFGEESPMDQAFGETPAEETAEAKIPELAPIEDLEHTSEKLGDPALDALVNVIEMLIKKDMGKNDMPSLKKDDAAEEKAGAEEKSAEAPAAPFPPKKSKPPKSEESGPAKEDSEKESEPKMDEEEEKPESDDAAEEKEVKARLNSLFSLPKAARLEKASNLRKLAEMMENDNKPDFLKGDAEEDDKKDDETMDKAAIKYALLHLIEALDNSEKNVFPADPEDRKDVEEEKEEKEEEDDRKAKVVAHLAKLRMQRTATVDGKSEPTPKEMPKSTETVESPLKGDAPIAYAPATADRPISTIETKKQKLPTDATHGDEAEVYFGDTPESKREVQTEKDSAKGVTNKRTTKDMGTYLQPDHPVAPTEKETGDGSHQKAKDWETAKAESDKTPTGDRLVGLASAIELARLAQAKGLVATEQQYDELVVRYASLNETRFTLQKEAIEMVPTPETRSVKANDATFEDNGAVEDVYDESPETPSAKKVARKPGNDQVGLETTAGLKSPITLRSVDSTPRISRGSKFAALANLGWETIETKIEKDAKLGLR